MARLSVAALAGVVTLALAAPVSAKPVRGVLNLYGSQRPVMTQLASLPDGSLLLGGTVRRKKDDLVAVMRFSARGRQDVKYGQKGIGTAKLGNAFFSSVRTMVVEPGGAAVLAGNFSTSGSSTVAAGARFLANGTPDRALGNGGEMIWENQTTDPFGGAEHYDPVSPRLVRQASGPTLWLGNSTGSLVGNGCSFALDQAYKRAAADSCLATAPHGEDRATTARLITDAVADPSGGAVAAVGGYTATGPGDQRPLYGIARIDAAGMIDRAFGTDGANLEANLGLKPKLGLNTFTITLGATAIAARPGGGWIVGGAAPKAWGLAGYTATSALDPAFGTGGTMTLDPDPSADPEILTQLVTLRDGHILALGNNFAGKKVPRGFAAVVRGDGRLDRSFAKGGKLVITPGMLGTDEIYELSNAVEQKDGRIVILATGWSERKQTTTLLLFRLKRNGALDRSFGR